MDLLRTIRSERAERRRKQAYRSSLFDRINSLVKAHALDDNFLRRLEAAERSPAEDGLARVDLPRKEPFEPPLFSLSTEAQYHVTMAILARVDNPYLYFVTCPGEILLCRRLFRANPRLRRDSLARHHFKTLLLAEMAGGLSPELREEIQATLAKESLDEDDRRRLAALRDRIAGVPRFAASAENAGAG